jgi:predicted NBD/HSP70 family sugar kinase
MFAWAGSARFHSSATAAPGPVDVRSGTVLNPPLLAGWQNVPVRDALAKRLDMPVLLEKDVTAAAVAELWKRADPAHANMIFFYYGTGVGAGLVVQNEAIRGVSSNAGDVGSMIVGGGSSGTDHRRWRLGDAVMPRLLVREAIDRGVLDDPLVDLDTIVVQDLYGQLARAAGAGDPAAAQILEEVAADISTSLVSLINVLDVNRVVFGGPFWAPVADFMLDRVRMLVRTSQKLIAPHPIEFITSSIGDDVAAVGAASLVLDHAFSPRPAGLLIQH